MSVEKIISQLNSEREAITSILKEFKTAAYRNKILRLNEALKNPGYLLIEVILVTVISIILLPFLYNFIFIVPVSPLTFTVYLILVVFIIIIPFNLILNRLCSWLKSKYFKASLLENSLAELTRLERDFLAAIFQNYKIESKPRQVDVAVELELNDSALKTSLFYNTYILTNGVESKIEITDFYKSISGRYLIYEENLKNQYDKLELIVDNNIIWKNTKLYEGKLRLLPSYRWLTRLLFNFKKLSFIGRVELIVEDTYLRIIVYEPKPPAEEWLSARILETITGFKKFILNFALTGSVIL